MTLHRSEFSSEEFLIRPLGISEKRVSEGRHRPAFKLAAGAVTEDNLFSDAAVPLPGRQKGASPRERASSLGALLN